MKTEEREFNIFAGERPRVLFLGNGLCRTYNGRSWDRLLDFIKDREDFPLDAEKYVMPMPLKSAMLTNNKLASKMRKIVEQANPSEPSNDLEKITWQSFTDTNPEMRELIRRIVKHFDYVLTTNYSYEIEMAMLDAETLVPDQIVEMMNYHEIDSAQLKFLINTYNLVNGKPIWHIHGEARKPDSMIIGSAYYGKLLRRCIERIDGGKTGGKEREYKRNIKNGKPQKIGSWVDAFVLGNVYILGLGLDFSESDLWWLIDYKSSNPEFCGRTFYYEPQYNSKKVCPVDEKTPCEKIDSFADERQCRKQLLKTYRVITNDLGVTIKTADDYKIFYDNAVKAFDKELMVCDR